VNDVPLLPPPGRGFTFLSLHTHTQFGKKKIKKEKKKKSAVHISSSSGGASLIARNFLL
jgi:hypothetical protein